MKGCHNSQNRWLQSWKIFQVVMYKTARKSPTFRANRLKESEKHNALALHFSLIGADNAQKLQGISSSEEIAGLENSHDGGTQTPGNGHCHGPGEDDIAEESPVDATA